MMDARYTHVLVHSILGVLLLGSAVLLYIVLLLLVGELHYSRGIHQGVVYTYIASCTLHLLSHDTNE